MASRLKSIFHPKYGPAHLFAMFPVLQACSSSTKNDEEAWHNKTPPIKRYSERNANGRFGVQKKKDFPARDEGKRIWAAKRKLSFTTDTENSPTKRATRSSAVCNYKCLFVLFLQLY
jgi:hypothetical protein